MVKANIYIIMVHNMFVTGNMINNMDMVKKHGQMAHIMKDNMKNEKNMVKEN